MTSAPLWTKAAYSGIRLKRRLAISCRARRTIHSAGEVNGHIAHKRRPVRYPKAIGIGNRSHQRLRAGSSTRRSSPLRRGFVRSYGGYGRVDRVRRRRVGRHRRHVGPFLLHTSRGIQYYSVGKPAPPWRAARLRRFRLERVQDWLADQQQRFLHAAGSVSRSPRRLRRCATRIGPRSS